MISSNSTVYYLNLALKEATRKGSPAEQAGCRDGVKLKLVGGHVVQAMPQQEVLRLLAADHNMIVGEGFKVKIPVC